jgi:hypothetical protein
MKVLLDPVYTQWPSRCASNAKMKTLVMGVLAHRSDVFFYWMVPTNMPEGEAGWFPDHPNVRLVPYPYAEDRIKEFLRFRVELEKIVAFNGHLWDWDVMVTNRTAMVPTIKTWATKAARTTLLWSKKVFLIEDMPIMSFKKLLPLHNPEVQDITALAGYMCADRTAISAYWERDEILQVARPLLQPAGLRKISTTMVESTSMWIDDTELKKKEHIEPMLRGDRPFCVAYVGRMTQSQTRIPEIFSIMEKNFVYKNVRCIVSTVSINSGRVRYEGKQGIPDWIEVHRPPREEFWRLFQEEVDVFVFMSKEEDYSMSLMEPLVRGCPAVLIRDKWSEGTVGKDYPFFVKNQAEAYGMVMAFRDNYAEMYRKFCEWSRGPFVELLRERNSEYLPRVFEETLHGWGEDYKKYVARGSAVKNNEIVAMMDKQTRDNGDTDLVVFDMLERLDADGKLRHLSTKMSDEFNERIRLAWATDWNYYRLGLMRRGYVDASTETGHMVRLAD